MQTHLAVQEGEVPAHLAAWRSCPRRGWSPGAAAPQERLPRLPRLPQVFLGHHHSSCGVSLCVEGRQPRGRCAPPRGLPPILPGWSKPLSSPVNRATHPRSELPWGLSGAQSGSRNASHWQLVWMHDSPRKRGDSLPLFRRGRSSRSQGCAQSNSLLLTGGCCRVLPRTGVTNPLLADRESTL